MELPIFKIHMNFSWIHLWVKNRCLRHPCFKNLCKIAQASKNSDSNAQHFISDLPTHSWCSLHALCTPRLSTPLYTVMNRCLYLTQLLGFKVSKVLDNMFSWDRNHMASQTTRLVGILVDWQYIQRIEVLTCRLWGLRQDVTIHF
jgi:hypothetical protein